MNDEQAHVRLRNWRVSSGISQAEAARRVDVSQPIWSEWESGSREPRLVNARAIEAVTGGVVLVAMWPKHRDGAAA